MAMQVKPNFGVFFTGLLTRRKSCLSNRMDSRGKCN